MCCETGKQQLCRDYLKCQEMQLLSAAAGFFINLDGFGIITWKCSMPNITIVFCSLKASAECTIRQII